MFCYLSFKKSCIFLRGVIVHVFIVLIYKFYLSFTTKNEQKKLAVDFNQSSPHQSSAEMTWFDDNKEA